MPELSDGAALVAIERAIREHARTSSDTRDGIGDIVDEAVDYARDIAPVDEGEYKDGIDGDVVFRNGAWRGRITARDFKSRFIEYGTVDTPKFGVLRRTREHLQR